MSSNANLGYAYQHVLDLHDSCGNGLSFLQFYQLINGDELDYVCRKGELKYIGTDRAIWEKKPTVCPIPCKCVCPK